MISRRGSSRMEAFRRRPVAGSDQVHDPVTQIEKTACYRDHLLDREALVAISAIRVGEHQRAAIATAQPMRLGPGRRRTDSRWSKGNGRPASRSTTR